MSKKATPANKEEKIHTVVLITSETPRETKLSNTLARQLKRQAMRVSHAMGHTDVLEHNVRLGIGADWPTDSPGFLRLRLSHIGMSLPSPGPRLQLQTS